MNLANVTSPQFSGHETFTFRYGWLKKAVDVVAEDETVFRRDDAITTLGVGKNMVRSIRHWGLATGLLEENPERLNNRGRWIRPSWLGSLLLGAKGLDPYLEDPATLWLLHWQLASTPTGPTTWYWAFNELNDVEFTKEQLVTELQRVVKQAGWTRIAPSSLRRDVDCFVRTYAPSRITRTVVAEDTFDCPLTELGLLREIEPNRLYAFSRADHPSLPAGIVHYALLRYWDVQCPNRETLGFEEVAYRAGSPGRVFKLSEDALCAHLETLDDLTRGAMGYDTTAGLRQIYRRSAVDPVALLQARYTPANGRRR